MGGETPGRGDPFNIYSLSISSPEQTYYLNRGESHIERCWPIDYTKTVDIAGGATVTLYADTVEQAEIMNLDGNGQPLVIPGVTQVTQPYNGQFILMDVVSVTSP